MARIVSLTILLTLIVVLGITFFRVIAPYLLPLFLAAVVTILCQPLFRYFIWRTKGRTRLAAGLTTTAVLGIVLIPLLVGTFIAAVQLFALAQDKLGSEEWRQRVTQLRQELEIDQLAAQLMPYIYGMPAEESVDTEALDESQATPGEVSAPGEVIVSPAHRERINELQAQLERNLQAAVTAVSQRTLGMAGAAAGAVPGAALGFLGAMLHGLISALIFVIALYYFLADGPVLLSAAEKMIPVHVEYQRELLSKFDSVVRAVVTATFLAAISQGVVTAVALKLCGFDHFFIFFIVATLASMIPLAGAWLVWGPFAVWLGYQGHWGSFIFLVVVGAGVVGTMDNVIRTYVLHTDVKLHPLLAFVSVMGGLQAMGLWGVFVGPIIASCLHALVKIFNTELKEFSVERFSGTLESEGDVRAVTARIEVDQHVAEPNSTEPAPAGNTVEDNKTQTHTPTGQPSTEPSESSAGNKSVSPNSGKNVRKKKRSRRKKTGRKS